MDLRRFRTQLTTAGLAALAAIAVAGCTSGSGSSPNTPVNPNIPNPPALSPSSTYSYVSNTGGGPAVGAPKGPFFDISFVDNSAHLLYIADRTTDGIDVINSVSGLYYGTAAAGQFVGSGFNRPIGGGKVEAHATNGGPNGVASVGNGLVAAGDGDSTLKFVQVFGAGTAVGNTVKTVSLPNPYVGPNLPGGCQNSPGAQLGVPTQGGSLSTGNGRADELAWDPTDNVVIVISDAACPVFATFVQASAPFAILKSVPLPTANNGGEQPVWDPAQGKFLVAIPGTTDPVTGLDGAVYVFDPKAYTYTVLPVPTGCGGPTGMALGKNENLFMNCGGNPSPSFTTINAVTGALINSIPSSGGDEVWYSPGSDRFYGSAQGAPIQLTVANGSGQFLANIPAASGSHSIAVDSSTENVFVPTIGLPASGTTPAIPAGIAIYHPH